MKCELMPTLLELTGVQFGPTDGFSLAQHLLDEKPLSQRTIFWRSGDSKAVRWKHWKLVRIHDWPFELYDLAKSLYEHPTRNLISQRQDIRDELLRRLNQWEAEIARSRQP